ncbi:helix-turn-helix domain-containing protein [Candidatus Gracilibacteria bacterium]|nr:helix-turn-helix domain-containing protein [Candidatus Gracilibacteria bacterium]
MPDVRRSQRFAPDAAWPQCRSRVVLPMRLGTQLVGLLDLHNHRVVHHNQAELLGLQTLADQVAITLRNVELVREATESRAAAEQADLLKTQLLANVSHELRTPLNVILGYSQSALTAPDYQHLPTLLRDLRHIYTSGDHLLRLINDLLDMSRAEIDELDLFPEQIDMAYFLTDALSSFSASVRDDRGITWQLDLPAQLPAMQVDPLRLRQIVLNLLSNANVHTQRGSVVLGARVAEPQLHLWVRDTGSGISADQQDRIFEPFVTNQQSGRAMALAWLVDHTYAGAAASGQYACRKHAGRGQHLPRLLAAAALEASDSAMHRCACADRRRGLAYSRAVRAADRRSVAAASGAERGQCCCSTGAAGRHRARAGGAGSDTAGDRWLCPAALAAQRAALQHVPVLVVSSRSLSADDIRQLDYPNVTFQPKYILAQQEAEQVLRRVYADGCVLPQATSTLVRRALAYVQQHYDQALSRQEIAEAIGINKNYLSDVFHDELGVAPWEYLNRYRVHKAKDLLRTTNAPIAAIAALVGFDDSSYFGRVFHRYVGRSPRAYRQ